MKKPSKKFINSLPPNLREHFINAIYGQHCNDSEVLWQQMEELVGYKPPPPKRPPSRMRAPTAHASAPAAPLPLRLCQARPSGNVALLIDKKLAWSKHEVTGQEEWIILSEDNAQIHEVLVKTGVFAALVARLARGLAGP